MDIPRRKSKQWKEIISLGCGIEFDYYGDADCGHGYDWDCGDCPVRQDADEKRYKETINV